MRARTVRIEGDLAFIPLTKGYQAVIDAADVGMVSARNWRAMVCRRKDGSIRAVYAYTKYKTADRTRIWMLHRVLLAAPDGVDVDHADCDGLNNRRKNLRLASEMQNTFNRRTPLSNTSGVKGVTWHRSAKKWQATIRAHAKSYYLGVFDDIEAARVVVEAARNELHGAFARTA